jgi:predicted phosphodiesterase
MNPGSPSIPKEGSVPSYIVIEDGTSTIKSF